MAPSKLEERLSGLISQLAVTNEGLLTLTRISERHENVIFGKDDEGGLVSKGNVTKRTLEEHDTALSRLETSCQQVVSFMESQVEINKAQAKTNSNLVKALFGLGIMVFLILLLIGVADISALHALLSNIKLP